MESSSRRTASASIAASRAASSVEKTARRARACVASGLGIEETARISVSCQTMSRTGMSWPITATCAR